MNDKAPAKTREQLLQDWLLADTKELFDTAKGLIAEGVAAQAAIVKAADEIRRSGAASRDHAAAVERALTKHDERLSARLSAFESALVQWAKATRTATLAWLFGTVLLASFVGTIAGALVIAHMR